LTFVGLFPSTSVQKITPSLLGLGRGYKLAS
jgi:hypothetical protein